MEQLTCSLLSCHCEARNQWLVAWDRSNWQLQKMSSATLTFRDWSNFLRNDAKRIRLCLCSWLVKRITLISCSRCWTPKRGSPRPPAGFEWGKSGFAHCWFDIWPIAYSSSGTPATMQWYFCFSWEPHWFYPSDGCECWSCKSKVPNVSSKLFWLLGPNCGSNRYTQGGCATLAILLQMYF